MRLVALLIGYAFGAVSSAYILGKFYGIDIREHGSKNAGMTNVNRILGKKPAVFVFLFDVAKAIAAFLIATTFLNSSPLLGLYAGLGVVLGHDFPFYLKFRGGKGIASTLGVIIMFDFRVAIVAFTVGLVLVLVFRYISLASLMITLLFPILLAVFSHPPEAVGIAVIITALAWILHRDNIIKLWNGNENKFSLKSEKK